MKILGVDYGTRRLGLAVSDPDGRYALSLGVLEIADPDRALEELVATVDRERPERIVVGLPLRMDGSEGDAAGAVREFIAELAGRTGLPVDAVDERLTSEEAKGKLRETGLSRRRKRTAVNAVAAQIILQAWLDSTRGRR